MFGRSSTATAASRSNEHEDHRTMTAMTATQSMGKAAIRITTQQTDNLGDLLVRGHVPGEGGGLVCRGSPREHQWSAGKPQTLGTKIGAALSIEAVASLEPRRAADKKTNHTAKRRGEQ